MKKYMIYDLPVRIFHALFSLLFVAAFLIVKTVDDDNPIFSYHMLAGLILGGLVLLRIIWGFIGTPYARFKSFSLRFSDIVEYLRVVLSGNKKIWIGHNPASSWGTLIMLCCSIALAITGILMTSGYKKTFEDVHELFANIFLVFVLLHIAGVLLHAFRHKDGIELTMLHGRKLIENHNDEVISTKPIVAMVFVLIIMTFSGYLFKNYDTKTMQLEFFGKTLFLGEQEKKSDNHDKNDKNKSDHKKRKHDYDD